MQSESPAQVLILAVRIILVAYKSGPDLQNALNALAAQTCQDFEVVIVNNQCPEDCTRELILPNERYSIKTAPENLGFAGGCNFGAEGANTDWIVTLNPDAWPRSNWLAEMLRAGAGETAPAMLSSTLLQADNPDHLDGFGDVYSIFGIAWRGGYGHAVNTLPETNVQVFGPCGAAAFYRRCVFERVGGFDPWYFCYLEDVDLALRIQRMGGACLQVRQGEVLHVGSGSVGKGSDFQIFQTYRNNLRVIVKNAPRFLLPVQLLAYSMAQIWLLWRTRKQAGGSARWRGLKAGVASVPQAIRDRHQTRTVATTGSAWLIRRMSFHPRSVRNLTPFYWRDI